MKGNLIIISSPSGGGKGTLIREILQSVPDIGYSVSLTTRAPRFGEEDGRDYHFVTQQEFQDCIDRGGFLEYAEVHGNLYGTSRDQTDRITAEGRDVILEIDVQGAIAVLEKVPDAVSIFILPPSFEVLKARLTARNTEDAAGLALRLRNSITEVMQYERFDYVIVNEEVPVAARLLSSIILAERQKRNRQSEAIGCILDSFAAANEKTTG
ncbi:MAG: guanylate kinase [Blastocatellia bacterium]|nr:guanylate kinase [Chloracidobacterium sp.]MBL8183327.1 guanylate kinase [Blastocatellia bacterium]HRJ89302.1 guanylate kinase [Pyrinomonadaceae bacterium]HRK51660.1 guanylate kinase [Pyrinomonadaceae bacterium]